MALPSTCIVLVAEDDPIVALDLADSLGRFGCTVLGPVASSMEGLQLIHRQRPSIALLSASVAEGGFLLLGNVLASLMVPFGVVATGSDHVLLRRNSLLREAPRLHKPFNSADLHKAASDLYRADLQQKIAQADDRIAGGTVRVAEQLRLVEKLAAAGTSTVLAESLLNNMTRGLRLLRTSRTLMTGQLGELD